MRIGKKRGAPILSVRGKALEALSTLVIFDLVTKSKEPDVLTVQVSNVQVKDPDGIVGMHRLAKALNVPKSELLLDIVKTAITGKEANWQVESKVDPDDPASEDNAILQMHIVRVGEVWDWERAKRFLDELTKLSMKGRGLLGEERFAAQHEVFYLELRELFGDRDAFLLYDEWLSLLDQCRVPQYERDEYPDLILMDVLCHLQRDLEQGEHKRAAILKAIETTKDAITRADPFTGLSFFRALSRPKAPSQSDVVGGRSRLRAFLCALPWFSARHWSSDTEKTEELASFQAPEPDSSEAPDLATRVATMDGSICDWCVCPGRSDKSRLVEFFHLATPLRQVLSEELTNPPGYQLADYFDKPGGAPRDDSPPAYEFPPAFREVMAEELRRAGEYEPLLAVVTLSPDTAQSDATNITGKSSSCEPIPPQSSESGSPSTATASSHSNPVRQDQSTASSHLNSVRRVQERPTYAGVSPNLVYL